jgi:hypothetical protein
MLISILVLGRYGYFLNFNCEFSYLLPVIKPDPKSQYRCSWLICVVHWFKLDLPNEPVWSNDLHSVAWGWKYMQFLKYYVISEYYVMDNIQKLNNSKCNIPFSKPFRIDSIFLNQMPDCNKRQMHCLLYSN